MATFESVPERAERDRSANRPDPRRRTGSPVLGRSLEADTKRIMAAIVELLPDDAYRRRTPTPEELAATYPPGYAGDPERESQRRPGTD